MHSNHTTYRSVISSGLAFGLVLSQLLVMILLIVNWSSLKRDMKLQLLDHTNPTEVITYDSIADAARVKWITQTEIVLNGKRYDVVEKSQSGSQITLKAIHDTREESLLQEIAEFFQSNGVNPTTSREDLLSHFTLKNALPLHAYVVWVIPSEQRTFAVKTDHPVSFPTDPPKQPPRS